MPNEILPHEALDLAFQLRYSEKRANAYAVQFVVSRGLRFIETTTQTTLRQFLMEHGGDLSTADVVHLLAGQRVERVDSATKVTTNYQLEPVDANLDKFISAEMVPVLRELFRFVSDWECDFSDVCHKEDWE